MNSCPRCHGGLTAQALPAGAACSEGHGAFLTPKELAEALPRHTRAKLDAAFTVASETSMGCPGCGTTMRVFEIQFPKRDAIVLDGCPNCHGVWFDVAELPPPMRETKRELIRFNSAPGALSIVELISGILLWG